MNQNTNRNQVQVGTELGGRRPLPPSRPLPRKTPLWAKVFAVFSVGLLLTVSFVLIDRQVEKNEAARAAAVSASASAHLSALEKEAWDKARHEQELVKFRADKDQAFMWCRNQGDVPVMGFGPKVICLRSESVAWEQKLEEPPW